MGKRIKFYKEHGFIKLLKEAMYIEPIRLRAMIDQRCRPSRIDWNKTNMLHTGPDGVEY